ncbi:MAG: hypothetical protein LBT75_00045 [Bacilli bacterium]|jgi:hypothetical protein|nr:hypothetical protein [Bacilli bacterium]
MGFIEAIDYDDVVDYDEEIKGFKREINRLLQINSRTDYYIEDSVFGFGLEIEVSAKVQRTHFMFLIAMLNNIISLVNYRGNFVFDRTIKGDYGFEICLDPLDLDDCVDVYFKIREIIDFSNGVLSVSKDNSCGLHINIKADERIKSEKFRDLFNLIDCNDDDTYAFNEYKRFIDLGDFESYLKFQQNIANKYLAVNLLKNNLIELRCVNSEITKENFVILLKKIKKVFYGEID